MIFTIHQEDEPKPKREYRLRGRPNIAAQETMKECNDWITARYFNHASCAGHIRGELHDQVNKERDILEGDMFGPDGRSLNKFPTRGMCIDQAIMRQYDTLFRAYKRPETGYLWWWYLTPIMYFYDRAVCMELSESPLAEYCEKIPTYRHNAGAVVHEIRLYDRVNVPTPLFIVVGKTRAALRKEERVTIEEFHEIAKCDVLHLPHINLVAGKKADATGNEVVSINAIRIIRCIQKVFGEV